MPNVHAVILAGGSGTRFWPLSRQDHPKQLLPLAGTTGEPLIAATVRRIEPLIPPENVWIATGPRLVDPTVRVLPRVPRSRFLVEPVARNTAAPIGWAASTIARQDPDALVAVLPSDHFVRDEPGFRDVLARALSAAEEGFLTTIGIVPTRPETGYGYIELGDRLRDGVHAVARFVEKPSRDRAQAFVDGGRHLWNGGMFFFRAGVMKQAIAEHLPALSDGLDALDAAAVRGEEEQALPALFASLPSVSIDHGVMEKAAKLAVVPGDFGWNDVGSWEVAWELAARDAAGNALPPGSVAIDAKDNLVRDETTAGKAAKAGRAGKTWALVGVSDLVIVETDDAFLVMPRTRAQDVRAVVDALRARGDKDRL
jgi:mannose-1-phosphate guanylyltransferase